MKKQKQKNIPFVIHLIKFTKSIKRLLARGCSALDSKLHYRRFNGNIFWIMIEYKRCVYESVHIREANEDKLAIVYNQSVGFVLSEA